MVLRFASDEETEELEREFGEPSLGRQMTPVPRDVSASALSGLLSLDKHGDLQLEEDPSSSSFSQCGHTEKTLAARRRCTMMMTAPTKPGGRNSIIGLGRTSSAGAPSPADGQSPIGWRAVRRSVCAPGTDPNTRSMRRSILERLPTSSAIGSSPSMKSEPSRKFATFDSRASRRSSPPDAAWQSEASAVHTSMAPSWALASLLTPSSSLARPALYPRSPYAHPARGASLALSRRGSHLVQADADRAVRAARYPGAE